MRGTASGQVLLQRTQQSLKEVVNKHIVWPQTFCLNFKEENISRALNSL